ncbi:MAG: HAD-IA family hydrolase [Clostridiaceae bacterium]|nr:HAD-IA family hydrolase [Clostridiaceae bacterium]
MIKGVFLDLGWTLFRPVNSDWFINQKVLEFTTLDTIKSLPQDKRTSVFDKALKYLDDHHRLTTEDEEIEQFTQFYTIIATELPELGINAEQAERIAAFKVFDTSNYVFFDNVKETLLRLKQKYKLGVISDTWPSADRILRRGGVEDLFDTKTYSCHLGTWKPDKRMYLHALEQMGLRPEETVFVDDWEGNLDGAAQCGIRPILIRSRGAALIPGARFSEDTIDSGKYPSITVIEEHPELLETEVFTHD